MFVSKHKMAAFYVVYLRTLGRATGILQYRNQRQRRSSMLWAVELMEGANSFMLQICSWWRHPASTAFRACEVKWDHQMVYADVWKCNVIKLKCRK